MSEMQTSVFGRPMSWPEQQVAKLKRWARRVRRKLPYLVWHGDEIDCRVTLREIKLGGDQTTAEHIFAAEALLRDCGVGFDAGMGRHGRDWEWDFSLSGPVSIQFLSRASKPERRTARPKLRLVVNNGAA